MKKIFLQLAFWAVVAGPLFSQAVLLKDIFPGTEWSYASADDAVETVGSVVFFTAKTPDHGVELWKTDGTPGGTVLVKDINPGAVSSSPNNFRDLGGILLFTASNGANGRELWRSDGTEAGTTIIRDIDAGAGSGISDNIDSEKYYHIFGGRLFFPAKTAAAGTELWKTDGTMAGTSLVRDIWAGSQGSFPGQFETHGSTLFFAARTSAAGRELWKTDGTGAGTVLVKDIQTTGFGDSDPSDLRSIGSTLIFIADDGVHAPELWKTDGTAAGTVLVKDIKTNTVGTFVASGFETQPNTFENRFARVGDVAFFFGD